LSKGSAATRRAPTGGTSGGSWDSPSETGAEVAVRDAAICAAAVSYRAGLFAGGGVPCGVNKSEEREPVELAEPRKQRRRERVGVKPLQEFQADSTYGGDLHRADMAWTKHAASCGLTLEQIKDELLDGRDLAKKGSRKRQVEYAERTACKAIEQMQ
jgi:hypothetical protein